MIFITVLKFFPCKIWTSLYKIQYIIYIYIYIYIYTFYTFHIFYINIFYLAQKNRRSYQDGCDIFTE